MGTPKGTQMSPKGTTEGLWGRGTSSLRGDPLGMGTQEGACPLARTWGPSWESVTPEDLGDTRGDMGTTADPKRDVTEKTPVGTGDHPKETLKGTERTWGGCRSDPRTGGH